jgi:hypothetical protein
MNYGEDKTWRGEKVNIKLPVLVSVALIRLKPNPILQLNHTITPFFYSASQHLQLLNHLVSPLRLSVRMVVRKTGKAIK